MRTNVKNPSKSKKGPTPLLSSYAPRESAGENMGKRIGQSMVAKTVKQPFLRRKVGLNAL